MNLPIFALALDAVPPALLDRWISQGVVPCISRLCARGVYGRLTKADDHPHEASWTAFLQGCVPHASGEWGQQVYQPDLYRVDVQAAHSLNRHPPFYALIEDRPSLIFDVPQAPIVETLQGSQALGWGLEGNVYKCRSRPPHLLNDIIQRYGPHAFLGSGNARIIGQELDGTVSSFRLPSIYDPVALHRLEEQIINAIGQRAVILNDLMAQSSRTLVFAGAPEVHLAMHMLWHEPSRLAAIARAFDKSLEKILRAAPKDAYIALFSVSGMTANYSDLTTMLFLPEFLYRLQFGEAALALGNTTTPVPPPDTHYRKHWKEEVWALRTPRGSRELESPDEQELRNDPFDWSPLNWYRQLWPRMRAFALPSFSHGMVRINLRGRDPQGMVDPEEYASYCDELTDALWSLRNARSGRPIIKAVTRTRRSHTEDGEYLPPADLMITWNPEESTDVAESSLVGRIGPVPWLRTGGHSPDGFCILCGPGIKPGSALRENATITDLTATMLQMLGITLPSYVEGRSLI